MIIRIDFIVVGVEVPEPSTGQDDDYMLLPPWAVAVVVIGLASVAFVIIFGVSMVNNLIKMFLCNHHSLSSSPPPILQLAKRRKISRGGKGGKQAISLTEEMVYEMNRSLKIILR